MVASAGSAVGEGETAFSFGGGSLLKLVSVVRKRPTLKTQPRALLFSFLLSLHTAAHSGPGAAQHTSPTLAMAVPPGAQPPRRRLRVLALHGFRTSGAILREQVRVLPGAVVGMDSSGTLEAGRRGAARRERGEEAVKRRAPH